MIFHIFNKILLKICMPFFVKNFETYLISAEVYYLPHINQKTMQNFAFILLSTKNTVKYMHNWNKFTYEIYIISCYIYCIIVQYLQLNSNNAVRNLIFLMVVLHDLTPPK